MAVSIEGKLQERCLGADALLGNRNAESLLLLGRHVNEMTLLNLLLLGLELFGVAAVELNRLVADLLGLVTTSALGDLVHGDAGLLLGLGVLHNTLLVLESVLLLLLSRLVGLAGLAGLRGALRFLSGGRGGRGGLLWLVFQLLVVLLLLSLGASKSENAVLQLMVLLLLLLAPLLLSLTALLLLLSPVLAI